MPFFKESSLEIQFQTGMRMGFAHLEHESNIYDWQGSEVPWIGFDELPHFTKKMFFYMLSRNRSTSGVKPKIRATCNPDPDSWLRHFIAWWIGEDGYPDPKRAGKVRWFMRDGDELVWSDTKHHQYAKSVTFIPSKVEDNVILMEKDPSYMATLHALPYVERMQLLHGNWDIRPAAGLYFKRQMFEIVDAVPVDCVSVRYWDRASSEEEGADWTVGVRMAQAPNKTIFIEDIVRFRGSPLKVEAAIKNTASQDGKIVSIGIEQDPGQAGVMEAEYLARQLSGYYVKLNKVQKDKITRASPFSAQCEAGNVKLVRGPWLDTFFSEVEQFPEGKHDDQVDAASGAFYLLTEGLVGSFTKEMTTPTKIMGGRSKDIW